MNNNLQPAAVRAAVTIDETIDYEEFSNKFNEKIDIPTIPPKFYKALQLKDMNKRRRKLEELRAVECQHQSKTSSRNLYNTIAKRLVWLDKEIGNEI